MRVRVFSHRARGPDAYRVRSTRRDATRRDATLVTAVVDDDHTNERAARPHE